MLAGCAFPAVSATGGSGRHCRPQEVTRHDAPDLDRRRCCTLQPVSAIFPGEPSMTRQPDEDYDVVVHYFGQRGTRGATRPTWTVWLGEEKQGERLNCWECTERWKR